MNMLSKKEETYYNKKPASQKKPSTEYDIVNAGTSYTLRVHGGYTAVIADSLTYYYGSLIPFAIVVTANNSRVYIPKAGIIKRAFLYFYVATPSTAEDIAFSIRVNNTTDYAITTTGHLNAAQILISNNALNIPVAEGDYFEIKMVCPVWATNPAGVSPTGDILIECD